MSETPREVRLKEFFLRLLALPPADNFRSAHRQIAETLNLVEDELTSIPCRPENWQTDGRMYPPQSDSAREVAGFPGVVRLRNRSHNTFIAHNGAIEIRRAGQPPESGDLLLSKPGSNGRGVWEK